MNDSIRQAVNDRFVMDYDNIPGKGPLMLFRKLDDGTMTLATPDHIVDFVRWHTAELSRLAGRSQGWRPIDEAPKDGTWILAYDPKHRWRTMESPRLPDRPTWVVVRWEKELWINFNGTMHSNVTHWQPLPPPPDAA